MEAPPLASLEETEVMQDAPTAATADITMPTPDTSMTPGAPMPAQQPTEPERFTGFVVLLSAETFKGILADGRILTIFYGPDKIRVERAPMQDIPTQVCHRKD